MEQKIIQSKVDTFFLEEICPICNSGKILKSPNSKVYLTDPPQLDVMCNNNDCEYVSKRFEKELYPQIRYEYQPKEIETSKFDETKLNDNQLAFINQFLRNQLYIEINLKNNTSSQFKDDLDTLDIILQQLYNIDDYEKLSEKDWNSYSATIFHIYHNEENYIIVPKKETDEINDIYCVDLNLVGIWFFHNIYSLKIEYYTNYLDFDLFKDKKYLNQITLDDAITIISTGYPLFFETNTKGWFLQHELDLGEPAVSFKNKRKDFHFTFYKDKISIYEENPDDNDVLNNPLYKLTDVHHVCYVQAYLCGYYIEAINKMIYNEQD